MADGLSKIFESLMDKYFGILKDVLGNLEEKASKMAEDVKPEQDKTAAELEKFVPKLPKKPEIKLITELENFIKGGELPGGLSAITDVFGSALSGGGFDIGKIVGIAKDAIGSDLLGNLAGTGDTNKSLEATASPRPESDHIPNMVSGPKGVKRKPENSKQSDDKPLAEEDSETVMTTPKAAIKKANESTDKNFGIDQKNYSETIEIEKLPITGPIGYEPQNEHYKKIDTKVWGKDNDAGVFPTAQPAYQKNDIDTKKAFGYASPSGLQDRKMEALNLFRNELNKLQELREKASRRYPFNITSDGENIITKINKAIPEITAEGLSLKNANWDIIQSAIASDGKEFMDAGQRIQNQLKSVSDLLVSGNPLTRDISIEKQTLEATNLLEHYETLALTKAAFYKELYSISEETFTTKAPEKLKL